MVETKGYKIRGKSQTSICTDCSTKLQINRKLKSATGGSNVSTLDTRQFATQLCVACETDITSGNGGSISYPEEIATLLDKAFEDVGGRFGGVIPHIDSEYKEQKISEGVKKGRAIRTNHDPVVLSLQPNETEAYQELDTFLDTLSTLGRIRYTDEEFRSEDNEIIGYEFTVFAVQN